MGLCNNNNQSSHVLLIDFDDTLFDDCAENGIQRNVTKKQNVNGCTPEDRARAGAWSRAVQRWHVLAPNASVFIFSNATAPWVQDIMKRFQQPQLECLPIISCESLRALKPDKRAFDDAAATTTAKVNDCNAQIFFIDNDSKNVEVAKNAGWIARKHEPCKSDPMKHVYEMLKNC